MIRKKTDREITEVGAYTILHDETKDYTSRNRFTDNKICSQ